MRSLAPCILAFVAGCSGLDDALNGDPPPTWTCPVTLTEDRAVYNDPGTDVITVELQVDDLEALAAVQRNDPDASVPVVLREGAFSAPGTLKLRGKSTRRAIQKSYKVKLTPDTGLWRGQREINLNKHPFDLTRVRQKLAFDLFREVPGFTSLRTQFVHVVLNGESLGLYTQVEEPGKRFLAAHGLDEGGTIYKAEMFWFAPIDDPTLADPERLALIMEAIANPDPAKLDAMIDDVNDYDKDINEIVSTHFDRENYITWLAVNLLLGNWDTRSQNFMLYSPAGCARWYFLPWDYDGALGWDEAPRNSGRPRWKAGLSNFWAIPLHERFIQDPANVAAIRARMTQLRGGALSDAHIASLLASYRETVRSYVSASPDVWQLPVTRGTTAPADIIAQWDTEYDRMSRVVGDYDAEFDAVRGRPMPVILFAELSVGDMLFQWTPSYSLDGDGLTYDFALSTSPGFEPETMVEDLRGLRMPMASSGRPAPGTYFWRVVARSTSQPEENWQMSFNSAQMIVLQ